MMLKEYAKIVSIVMVNGLTVTVIIVALQVKTIIKLNKFLSIKLNYRKKIHKVMFLTQIRLVSFFKILRAMQKENHSTKLRNSMSQSTLFAKTMIKLLI